MENNLHKVRFRLAQDEDGYPPFTSEAMWCVRLNEKVFRLDNIPYFVTGVSYGDVISVIEDEDGSLNFHEVIEENGHSTLRVMFLDTSRDSRPASTRASELENRLIEMGCLTEISPSPEIIAIDVPPAIALSGIRNILGEGEDKGLWSFDEGTVAHSE
jgi:hypothetical protein